MFVKLDVWLILITTTLLIAVYNWLNFYIYLSKKYPRVLNYLLFENFKGVLPDFMIFDPYKTLPYLLTIRKEDDTRIRVHKAIMVFSMIVVLILSIYSFDS